MLRVAGVALPGLLAASAPVACRGHRPFTDRMHQMSSAVPAHAPFEVLLLGGDLGVYALARAFHEQYGVRSTVICRQATGPVMASRIMTTVALGDGTSLQDMLAEVLRRGEARRGDVPCLLLTNGDATVKLLADHREELSRHYVIPFIEADLLERISDKATFAELCETLGVSTPRTVVQDFRAADGADWVPTPVELPFPLVAKAALSSAYEGLTFPGAKKVYFVADQAGLDAVWSGLKGAGFRDRFVVQELIPGDDTWMRSITAYCDQFGTVTLLCSAQVLLEEHTPVTLGNPCAMLTGAIPEAMEQAKAMLEHVGYVGFANFDVKIDPRDGSFSFFEVNPRIGRNNYYVTAAGANVARFVVEDYIEAKRVEPVVSDREILYSLVPQRLLMRYLLDPKLRRRVAAAVRRGIVNPLKNRAEGPRRRAYAVMAQLNQVKKFATYYPRATDSGF